MCVNKKGEKDKMKKTATILKCVMLGGVLFGCSGSMDDDDKKHRNNLFKLESMTGFKPKM